MKMKHIALSMLLVLILLLPVVGRGICYRWGLSPQGPYVKYIKPGTNAAAQISSVSPDANHRYTFVFLPGIHIVKEIPLKSYCSYVGCGRSVSVLKLTENSKKPIFVSTQDSISYVTISGLELDGNKSEQISIDATHSGTTSTTTLNYPDGNWQNDELVGLLLLNVTDNSWGIISANTSSTVTVDALRGGSDNKFEDGDNCQIIYPLISIRHGLGEITHSAIRDCYIHDAKGTAITFKKSWRGRIMDCEIRYCDGPAILLGEHTNVISNDITNCAGGIWEYPGKNFYHATVVDNLFTYLQRTGDTTYYYAILSPATSLFMNNMVYKTGGFNIGSNNVIMGNRIEYSWNHGILLSGSNNIVVGNFCCNNGAQSSGTYSHIRVYGSYKNEIFGNSFYNDEVDSFGVRSSGSQNYIGFNANIHSMPEQFTGNDYAISENMNAYIASPSADVVYSPYRGSLYVLTPSTNININLSTSYNFPAGKTLIVINKSPSYTITFDPSGLNDTIASNSKAKYLYDGSEWTKLW